MKMTEHFEKVPIDKLVPYASNARTHSKEQILQLRSSIREFGFINPCLIDKDYNILAGHGRVLAAKEEGLTELPCVFVEHLTEAQKRAYILADNRLLERETVTDNDKYSFRCFLLRLGYIGEEYKDARRMLLQNLSGSSAYRHSKEESREND